MTTEILEIPIDSNLKKQADEFFGQFGITTKDAVSIFIHQSFIEGRIPFPIQSRDFNEETLEAIAESEMLLRDKNAKRYSSFAELWEEVESEI